MSSLPLLRLLCVCWILTREDLKADALLTVEKAVANLVGVNKKAKDDVEPLKSYHVESLSQCLHICRSHGCQSFNLNPAFGNHCVIYTRPICGEDGYELQDGDVGQEHYTVRIIKQSSQGEALEWLDSCWPRNVEPDEPPKTTTAPTTTTTTTTTTLPTTTTTTPTTTTTVPTTTTTVPTTTTTVPTTTTTVPTTTTTVPTTTTTLATTTTTVPTTTTTLATTTTTEGVCTEGINIDNKLCFVLLEETTFNDFEDTCKEVNAKMAVFGEEGSCKHFSNMVKKIHPEFPTFYISAAYHKSLIGSGTWKLGTGQDISKWTVCWGGQEPTHEEGKDCVGMEPPEYQLVELDCGAKVKAMCVYRIE